MARVDPLTLDQLADIARESLDNAVDLVNEADGLVSFGRFARGYAIAILSGEEFGKFMMCQGTVGHLPGDATFWLEFWRRFKSHPEKAANFTSMVGHVVEDDEQRRWFMENIKLHVDADQNRKFAGLYVDVGDDGTVTAPRTAVSPDSARAVVQILGTLIRSHAAGWEGVDFHDLYRESQAGAKQMIEALKTGDSETIMSAWDATLQRRSDTSGETRGDGA
jgi:AbiV family abortive infection protein